MHKKTVGVIRGGPSNEYEVSLKTGSKILDLLRQHHEESYRPVDIFVDQNGHWFMHGVKILPHEALHKIDVAFLALHGKYGEDGKIQHLCESANIPFTGSGSVSSAIGMNKVLSKKAFGIHGIKTPYWREIPSEKIKNDVGEVVAKLFTSFLLPAIVKPASSGSSIGVHLVRKYADMGNALIDAASHDDVVLIEEYIDGEEATCGVIDDYRNQRFFALPPVEIKSHSHVFDFDAKYKGKSKEICPANFTYETKKKLEELARLVHSSLGLRHYSRTDMRIHPRRGIYVLEVNTLPGLTEESLLPKSLEAIGSNLPEFLHHVISLALRSK